MIRTNHARFALGLMCLSGTVLALGLGVCGDSKEDTAPTSTPAAETPTTAPKESRSGSGSALTGMSA